ncbi:gliding motility-associated C-terminal domain-containing protein, partial [Emticicia sp.]|uniref:T9SS type B sorting domain-containing protein n=1 Tax=Emticicia sp. TaxID=1930953 RepID=UPI00375185C3
ISLCGTETATLTATGCVGTVKWSNTSTGTSISVAAGTYSAICNSTCGDSGNSNAIVITLGIGSNPPSISTTKTSICGNETATLTATGCAGIIVWSNASTGTSISVAAAGTYSAKCTGVGCGDSVPSNQVIITTDSAPAAPIISASKVGICGNETATLTASGCNNTVKWSTNVTGNSITVSTAGTYTATCGSTCGESGQSNAIVISLTPVPAIPTIIVNNANICGNETATLTVSTCAGIVTWSTGATTTSISVSVAGTYSATCKNSCGESEPSQGTVIRRSNSPAAPVISTDKMSVCQTEKATLTSTGCTGTITWSTGATGSSIQVSAGTYTATCANSCGISGNSNMVVIINGGSPEAPTVKADKTSLCETETAILTASSCSGTITWSNGTTGGTLTVIAAGTYTAVCKNTCGTSPSSSVVIIISGGSPSAPSLTTDKPEICSTETAVLMAAGCGGTITWSTGATGSTLTVAVSGTYTATCKNTCGTSAVSTPIIIKTKADCGGGCNVPTPVITASKTTICKPENITLTATSCTTGTVVWSTGQTGTSIVVKPNVTTIYSATCKVSNTCTSPISNTVQVKVGKVSTPTLTCSTDLVCKGESVTIKAYGCEGTLVWSTGQTGESIIVTPEGSSSYSAKCKVGDCESPNTEHLSIAIGVPNKPFVSCKNNVICFGGNSILTASGCTGTVVWSTGQTGAVLTVSPIVEKSTYSAVCKSNGGKCESEKSNEITVTVGKKVDATKGIAEIKNICPFNTTDLNSAILSEPSTTGGQFEFHTSSSPSSPIVTNPGAVGEGTYYTFERSIVGCYSDGTPVKVIITLCPGGITPPNPPVVDISVIKVASAKIVPVNEIVNYKVVVKNKGEVKVTGIEVRDILPSGLTFESVSSNAKYANGVVSIKIDSLKKGDSTTFTYVTKVTAAGKIVNKAELFKINEIDNILSNNSSEFSINDPTAGKMIGISKICDPAILVSDKIYNVPFVIYVTNLGSENVKKLQVKDDLDRAFGSGAKIMNDTITLVADAGLTVNTKYTGRGLNTNMLVDSSSSIKKGQKLAIRFTVKVDLKNATITDFFNSAEVTSDAKKDISTNGVNADPDGDGDPTNNEEATPIKFKIDISPDRPAIGIALSIVDSVKVDDKSYNVTYLALVKNFGNAKLTNVQVTDSLSKTFADSVTYQMVGKPTAGKNSTLKLNPNFNGKEDVNILIADSTSKLNVSQLDSIYYTVKVFHNGNIGPFANYAYAKAIGNSNVVTDISNTGIEIKINESSPTLLRLPLVSGVVIIPEAFSPNGDGNNDFFRITLPSTAKMISCDVYNRWGHVVFKDKDNTLATKGWDGTSNQGIRFGTEGVPDGTYYYAIDYELDGQRVHKVSYITVAR